MYTGFWIDSKVGNNIFYFDGKNQQTQIYVAGKKYGVLDDLSLGSKPVFRAENTQGRILSYTGLENFIYFSAQTPNIPSQTPNTIIFDNHNHALYFWYRAYIQGIIPLGLPVLHIDQHTDMNNNTNILSDITTLQEQEVFNFTNYACNVGNFIVPALDSGLISHVEQITTEYKLLHLPLSEIISTNYILDIDLDFWAPEMSIEKKKQTFETTRHLIKHARYITVATSPYFLDQKLAISLCHELFSK